MIIEDHPDYRQTLALILNEVAGFKVAAQFHSADEALRKLQDKDQIVIDTILLDLHLPGIKAIEAISWFKKYRPQAKIIILSQSNKELDVLQSLGQGADGYLLKSATMEQIIEGISIVSEGGAILDPTVAKFILETLHPFLPKLACPVELSKRELEVLGLISQGLSQKEIGVQLKISTYTVTDYLKNIYEKLHVKNAPAAVAKGFSKGILPRP